MRWIAITRRGSSARWNCVEVFRAPEFEIQISKVEINRNYEKEEGSKLAPLHWLNFRVLRWGKWAYAGVLLLANVIVAALVLIAREGS
jgi:hypothetical protein